MIGIYKIENTDTGQIYIGRSVRIPQRLYGHLRLLRLGRHSNIYLQRSFTKHGEAAFRWGPVILCRREDLPFYERSLIAGYRSDDRELGFNLTVAIEDKLGHTDEARAAISAFQRVYQRENKYERTAEIRAKIANSLIGRVGPNVGRTFSPVIRKKLSRAKLGNKSRLGKTRTPEEKAKISQALRRFYEENPEVRVAQSSRRTGQPSHRKGTVHSEATKEKMRAARLGKKASDETKAKLSASLRGKKRSESALENMKMAQQRRRARELGS